MSKTPSLVSIIIPTFNKWDLTSACLDRVRETCKYVPHEIIVVDNASTDGTPGHILDSYPGVRLLCNKTNMNFSGACNIGAQAANSGFLCFLNNDTLPFEKWLEPMVKEFTDWNDVGVVGSKLCFPDGTIQHAGVAFMRENRFPYHPYRGVKVEVPEVNHRREVQVVTGACMMMRKKLFTELGGFDMEYRNGGEDIELCLKARAAGWEVIYQPESCLIHYESQSPGRMDFNEQNIGVFFKHCKHLHLADEDAFYFEDNLHRIGDRSLISHNPLRSFLHDQDGIKAAWKHVADLQVALAENDTILAKLALTAKDWPDDAAAREWVAHTARKLELPGYACDHFSAAAGLRVAQAQQEAQLKMIQNSPTMSVHSNAFFTSK